MLLNYEQGHRAAQVMEQRGGGFASALAQAYFRADNTNAQILRHAFADLFEKHYEQWTEDKYFPNFKKETTE
jgi:phosphohistidine phosphatase SixA